MSEILIEKLELVLEEFRKLNADKLGGYGDKVVAMGEQIKSFETTLKQMDIPEEVRVRHEYVHEHRNINVWVRVMIWVTSVTLLSSIIFCVYYYQTYKVDAGVRKYNEARKERYDWLYNYFVYMRDKGASKTTVRYMQEQPPPQ